MAQQGPKRASSRRATSRESDVHEDEAWQLCQEVFEATAPGCLDKLHRRSLDLQVDVEVLEAPTLLQHREKGVTWLCQQFDKLGYRDEWFLSAVSLMDRASCAASAALNCKKEMPAAGLSKLSRVNAAKKAIQVEGFWVAAASLALNLTEVEAELECLDFQDLVKPFRQNAWQITMRTSGPKILSTTDFTASELCMMDLLEYRIQLPNAMDLLMEMCFGVRFALHSAGQDKSNVSWAGLQQARYPRLKGPGRAVVLSSLKAAITDRVQPQFVVLASFLLELLLVHKPAEAYKCSSPAAAAIAALELALHGFGTPPPEVCLQELQRFKERLVEEQMDQHDIMAALCQLWQRPPQGSAVMQKWLGRAATMFGGALPKAPKELVERIGRGKENIATPKAKSVLPAVASTPCRTAASADPKVDDPLATPPCLPMPPHKSKLRQAAQRTVAAVRLSPKGKKSVTPTAIRAAVHSKVSPVNKASLKRSHADDRKKALPKAKTKAITQAQHMVVPEGLEVKLHEPLMVSLPTKEESELIPAKTQLHVEAKEDRREPCPTQMVCQEPPIAALMDLTLEDSMNVKPDTALANVPDPAASSAQAEACAAGAVSSDVVVSDDEEDTEIAQASTQKGSWSPKNLRIYSEPVQPLQSTEVYCHREAHRALSLERKAGEWKTASQWQDQQAPPVTVQHEDSCAQLEEEELFQPPVKRQRTDVANWNPTGRQSCKENIPPCPRAASPRAVSISAGRGSSMARERVARPKASAKKALPLQPLHMPPKNIHENTRARKSASRDQPLKQKLAAAAPRKPKAGTPLPQPKQVLCAFSVSAETAAAARKREDDQMRVAKCIRRSQSRPSQKAHPAAQEASNKALVRSR